jgi:hypothetical protein
MLADGPKSRRGSVEKFVLIYELALMRGDELKE